jgi:hypothetical protein
MLCLKRGLESQWHRVAVSCFKSWNQGWHAYENYENMWLVGRTEQTQRQNVKLELKIGWTHVITIWYSLISSMQGLEKLPLGMISIQYNKTLLVRTLHWNTNKRYISKIQESSFLCEIAQNVTKRTFHALDEHRMLILKDYYLYKCNFFLFVNYSCIAVIRSIVRVQSCTTVVLGFFFNLVTFYTPTLLARVENWHQVREVTARTSLT